MTVLVLFIGFVLCVAGVFRGRARIRHWSPHFTVAVSLFWSSLIGCISAVAVLVATVLMAATFDETREMNPLITQAWSYAMSALRLSSGASFFLHLLFFLTPAHGATA
jgi:hypothetical protein